MGIAYRISDIMDVNLFHYFFAFCLTISKC